MKFSSSSRAIRVRRSQAGFVDTVWPTFRVCLPKFPEMIRYCIRLIAIRCFLFLVANTAAQNTESLVVVGVSPLPGPATELRSITVTFSQPVHDVVPEDLVINNQPVLQLSGSGATYTFSFDQPAFGLVDVSFTGGNGITDFADPPHFFNADDPSAHWTYQLRDGTAPTIVSLVPPAGAVVGALSDVEVRFSEEITGIDAGDLLMNGVAASRVDARAQNTYLFHFAPAPSGSVNVAWALNHGIADLSTPPNLLDATRWSYTVDPTLPVGQVGISEFLASAESATGLKDEDGDLEDWIEIFNSGSSPVDLEGWSLTNDPDDPGLWFFPAIILPAGERLVVFASAKDRRSGASGAKLHTNFKLNASGEYLALFNASSPRAATTEFRGGYPEQRHDYSYGWDGSEWRYYKTPTPGSPNGSSSIVGVVPKSDVSVKRGVFDAPFPLTLTNKIEGATIRYTVNGSVPTETGGLLYSTPLVISNSTVLRAAAFQENRLPSEIITHTYLFLDQVIHQPNNPAGFPVGSKVMGGYPSDYEMDPEIVNDPAYSTQMKGALLALPTLSLVLNVDDMFGATKGIYTHPLERGPQWERPCSVEFIPLDGKDFQADAGVQIQGNASRDPQKQPKHAMRLVFKGDYGAKNLSYKLFPDSPVTSFDTLVLRADYNNSWLHWTPTQRIRAQRTRDAWVKDSMRAMGGLASHNRYVHLYINGLYWGIYDPSERPDASFGKAYLGGEKEDYDVVNEGELVDGSMAAYNTLLSLGGFASIDNYNAVQHYLDMPQFIDYMLLHFFVGHEDWGFNKNWYTLRPRDGSRGFIYLPWDGETLLGDPGIDRVNNPDVASGLHTKLLASPEYKLDFADHVQRHLFNGGALTPAQNIVRWQARAREVELPIIAESARWGDYRRDVHRFQDPPFDLYTRDKHWRAEQSRLLNTYFPGRTTTVLNQLRKAGLYPAINAPSFNQFGGKIEPGFELQMSAPAGTIYFTMDGSDPRLYGSGELSPTASAYSGFVVLNSATHIKARVLSGTTWSALSDATFSPRNFRTPLRITEIMYNPEPPGDAYEFIELQNLSPLPFDASGYSLEGVNYIFPPNSIIQSNQIVVLSSAENTNSFATRYPRIPVLGRFTGQLLNRGERVALISPAGDRLYSVDYGDGSAWPKSADGGGSSLEINDPFGDPDNPGNWHASANLNGSPARPNSAPTARPIRINEIQTASDSGPDWIELLNTSASTLDLSGWILSEPGNTNRFIFPAGSSLQSNGYLVIFCDKLISGEGLHAPFALDSESEILVLENSSGTRMDVLVTGPQARGYTTGFVSEKLLLTQPTPGEPNIAAIPGSPFSLVINEWLASSGPDHADWIELYNTDLEKPVALQNLFIGLHQPPFEITSTAFVAPGGHVRLFADEQPGPNHLDFKLPAAGATITLYGSNEKQIDTVAYDPQAPEVSQGFYPDGSRNLVSFPFSPTPGSANSLNFPITSNIESNQFVLFWPSIATRIYRVERSNDLKNWTTWLDITATGDSSTAREPLSNAHAYYRILALPAPPP
jgi:hypothetical protein